ncbi:response regulator [Roseivivax isoporae]|uniref:Chemotaxis protein CheY n=1 Tax=Roseivivax isoporae LMG 25204 TaxID=1449351 RepID=X7F615_9RHOB|nr:response regulator transcription factor [Roseivivax isoporae]ETX27494.1 chemotaxis protein CheY [Roseivivax isoporae LMG 25204]
MPVNRVVVADDHPLFREGVSRTLQESGRFDVVATAETGRRAVALTAAHRPDLVLLDLSMPDGGLWALREIVASGFAGRVAMLTVAEDDRSIFEALEAGAAGYILKGVGSRELVHILSELAEGRSYVAPSLAARVLARLRAPRQVPEASPLDTLTRREEDILRLVSQGQSNKEVARALDLQEKTVKHYMTTILQKLQVRNRTEAALLARDRWTGC